MKICARLTFNGYCQGALAFYQNIFNGSINNMVRFSQAKELRGITMDERSSNFVYEAELEINFGEERFYLMVGDSPSLVFGGVTEFTANNDNITFDLVGHDLEVMKKIYEDLLEEGKTNIPMRESEHNFFASLIDKYGVCWNIKCLKEV